MKNQALMASAALAAAAFTNASAAVDVVDAPTGFFVPAPGQELSSPYYRGNGDDWGWTHGAIAPGFTSASLNISAFDVDFDGAVGFAGERDEIYAYDNGVRTFLGFLDGNDRVFAFTEFALGANFFDDIASGLVVEIVIDTLNEGWLVSLAKSTLTTDGEDPGNPNPVVPVPAAAWIMLAGIGAMVGKKKIQG